MCLHGRRSFASRALLCLYTAISMYTIEKLGVKPRSVCNVSFCKARCITLISAISLLFRTIFMVALFYCFTEEKHVTNMMTKMPSENSYLEYKYT